jgi:pimeloyl-ACP methyl ester carboxylesterase
LLFIVGGPGFAAMPFLPRVVSRLGPALAGYQLVMFDERGTGAGALRCPALQHAAGSSDLVVVSPGVVAACAESIGPARRYFTTPETVADIEQLRVALGASRLTLDGFSYGTYVVERYALTYPERVARIVLDSVIPQQGWDPLYLAGIQATARVLRSVCAQQRCTWDPAMDLRAVVRAHHDGPQLLDALVAESVSDPTNFGGALQALHAAAAGHRQRLDRFLDNVREGERASAEQISQGLHQSTACLSLSAPWDPTATTAERASLVARTVAGLSEADVFPYDRATASGNGLVQGCLAWPPTPPPALSDGDAAARLPAVPALLLAGDRDLSTPLAGAQDEAAQASDGRLVTFRGAGHAVQLLARDLTAVRRTLAQFLDQ